MQSINIKKVNVVTAVAYAYHVSIMESLSELQVLAALGETDDNIISFFKLEDVLPSRHKERELSVIIGYNNLGDMLASGYHIPEGYIISSNDKDVTGEVLDSCYKSKKLILYYYGYPIAIISPHHLGLTVETWAD